MLYLYQITLMYSFIRSTNECPYKNFDANVLPNEDSYQNLIFQRNEQDEFNGSSFGVQFWIQRYSQLNPTVKVQSQVTYNNNQQQDGELILTVEQQSKVSLFIYYNDENYFIFSENKIFQQNYIENIEQWNLFMITFYPKENRMLLQTPQSMYIPIILNEQIISFNLGGAKLVQGTFNLNFFRGRFTKLELINYFIPYEGIYQDQQFYCMIPSKYIISLGKYNRDFLCDIGCQACEENTKFCNVCDQDFQEIYFDQYFKACLCKPQYIEVFVNIAGYESYICVEQRIATPEIQMIEVPKSIENGCEFGYFDALINEEKVCIECPFQIDSMIRCIECLIQNNFWYKQPICKSDFAQINEYSNSTYTLLNRNQINFDVFIIDQMNELIHQIGVQEFCEDMNQEDCFKLKFKHLNQEVYVKCKQNYFHDDGECKFQNENCLIIEGYNKCLQCKEGSYLKNSYCYDCPINCQTCVFDNKLQDIQCNSCIKQFAVYLNRCLPCGLFCLYCIQDYDFLTNEAFLRCLKCVDDSQYFLSFDGVNCLQNTIPHCEYAFQALKNNISISTIDFKYQRQFDSEQIETYCGKCFDFYIFVFSLNKCLEQQINSCQYGYALTVKESNIGSDIVIDEKNQQFGSKINCLVQKNQPKVFCNQIVNCERCIQEPVNKNIICIQCEQGYYLDILTQQCEICDINQCLICHQENKFLKTDWRAQVYLFYLHLLQIHYSHSFTKFWISQNDNDYELVCDLCTDQFQLFNGKCLQSCKPECFKCKIINNKSLCVDCGAQNYERGITFQDDQCTICSYNCDVCKQISIGEMTKLNPYVNHSYRSFFQVPNFCFKPNNANAYYDSQIKQFIQCDIFKLGCEKHLVIKKELLCFDKRPYPRGQFSTINLDSLFSEKGLSLYKSANYQKVKKIIFQLKANKPQVCNIQSQLILNHNLNNMIFTLFDVELEFEGNNMIIWNLYGNVQFNLFSKITINGLIINIMESQIEKRIYFSSLTSINVILLNTTFQHLTKNPDFFQLVFDNTTKININSTSFNNLRLKDGSSLFQINKALFRQKIKINFYNSSFINITAYKSNIFYIVGNQNFNFLFEIQKINGILRNVKFIHAHEHLDGIVSFRNFILSFSELYYCQEFFNFSSFQKLEIYDFKISDVIFAQTNLLILSKNTSIQKFCLSQCNLKLKVQILINFGQSDIFSFAFSNLEIKSNQYQSDSNVLQVKRYNSQFSYINISEIIIKNNTLHNKSIYNIQNSPLSSSLFYFELDEIEISELKNERSFGINEFSFKDIQQLRIINTIITSGYNFKLKGIHQQFECFSNEIQSNSYGITFLITSTKEIFFENLSIISVETVDNPIIFIQSINKAKIFQQEIIQFSSIIVLNSLIIQTQLESSIALIQIGSTQSQEINIINSIFSQNIFQVYSSETLQSSALIFSINSQNSELLLFNSTFLENIIFNSETGIFYIESLRTHIENCLFQNNNQFIYEVLQPYLFWTFNESNQIYIENLQELFPIYSVCSTGLFISVHFSAVNNSFSSCQGLKATSLYIVIRTEGEIWMENNTFSSGKNFLFDNSFKGSEIYIDSSGSSSIRIEIQNIQATQIYSSSEGGFLFILDSQGESVINLNKIYLSDVFSKSGSFLFVKGLNSKKVTKSVNLQNIYYQSQKKFYDNFLVWYQYLIQKQRKKTNQTYIFPSELKSRMLIYIGDASLVRINVLIIQGLFFESAILVENSKEIQFSQILLQESYFNNKVIQLFLAQSAQAQMVLENIKFLNSSFGTLVFQIEVIQIFYQEKILQQCNVDQNYPAPSQLSSYLNNLTSFLQAVNSTLILNLIEIPNFFGLLDFEYLNDNHQLKIDNLKIININCSYCQNGLIFINFTKEVQLKKQEVQNIFVSNSTCGYNGCLKLFVNTSKNNYYQFKQIDIQPLNIELYIKNYLCQFNEAINGTCLYLYNAKIMILNSNFRFNNAQSVGGTIFSKSSDKNSELLIQETIIQNNFAQIGGGIFMDGQQEFNFQKLDSFISGNKAQFFANDISAIPSKLNVNVGGYEIDEYELKTLFQNDTFQIDIQQLKHETSQHGLKTNFTLLPNGIEVFQYKYFNWKNRTYIPFNITLRISALTNLGGVIKNLKDSFCKIQSRMIGTTDENESFSNKYTNLQTVYFDETTQDYNLDNLIIYKRENFDDDESLELQLWCSSIFVPIYNKKYPYNLLSQHNQYYLRIQIHTYPCQIGEIRNQTFQQCTTCNSQEGFFQLKLNETICQIRDESSTLQVQPSLLHLRSGFWRPYFHTSWISECHNSRTNCLGGWIEGDTSCKVGHLGALCEQCDLYQIKGGNQYFQDQNYSCSECQELTQQYLLLFLKLLWTLISISVSASDNFQSVNEKIQALRLQKIGFKVYFKQNSKVILIKTLINYLQIVNSIQTFQLDFLFFSEILHLFSIQTNQTLPYFVDCVLSKISDIDIHYIRMIWTMLLPLIYLNLYYWFYGIAVLFKKLTINLSFFSTTLIYLFIYFSPNIIGELTNLISYRFISGYYFIQSNVSARYDSQQHFLWMLQFCIPSLMILTIIIPFYLLKSLFKNRQKLDQKQVRQSLGFLYNEYKNQAYFWEMLKIFQKETLIFCLIFYNDEIFLKGQISLIILILYQIVSTKYKPYLLLSLNKLDYLSTQICLISISLSIGIYTSQQGRLSTLNWIFQILLLLINFHFVINLLFQILKLFLNKYAQLYYTLHDKFCEFLIKKIPSLNNMDQFKRILQTHKQKQRRIQTYFQKLKKYLKNQAKQNIRSTNDQTIQNISRI